jgi:hypothetical protein
MSIRHSIRYNKTLDEIKEIHTKPFGQRKCLSPHSKINRVKLDHCCRHGTLVCVGRKTLFL